VPAERKPSPVPGQELPDGLLGVVRTGHGQGLLVGRSSQLSELATALKQVADGAGGSLLVEGEAGIGKTSLVEESLRAPDQLGLQVYRATAEELERRLPFGAIVDCLGIGRDARDPRRMEIARLLHEVPPPTDWDSLITAPPGEFRVAEAIVTLVEELSVRGPLVVAIDEMTEAPCVDATCSADSFTSTGELHERVYVPHRLRDEATGDKGGTRKGCLTPAATVRRDL
jgi:hypothetical protein